MREFHATADLEIEDSQPMDPHRSGKRMAGFLRACLTVYEPTENVGSNLPTIAEMLATQVDATSGLLVLRIGNGRLRIDPSPLWALPPHLRVGEGASFITREGRALVRREKGEPPVPPS